MDSIADEGPVPRLRTKPLYRDFPASQRVWSLSFPSLFTVPAASVDAARQRTDCTSTDGLVALVIGAGPDTNRSAGLHSRVVVTP